MRYPAEDWAQSQDIKIISASAAEIIFLCVILPFLFYHSLYDYAGRDLSVGGFRNDE